MTYYANYTTLDALKTQYLDITVDSSGNPITVDDALLSAIIRDTSRVIDRTAARTFAPRLEVHYYDTPPANLNALLFDDDLLTLTTATNGDGTVFNGTTDYILAPYNERVKRKMILNVSASLMWQPSSVSGCFRSIGINGIWGFAHDGDWTSAAAVLTAAITTTTATTCTVTKNKILTGWLIRIDTEYLYVSSVASGASDDQLTIVRGVNGSTAAAHLINAPLDYWQCDYDIEMLCRQASAASYRIRANPIGDTIVIDGTSFATPKDVTQFIYNRLGGLGYRRTNIK